MQHEYELWLDESGSFIRDNENKINNNYHPSLVGGWLVKKNSIKINDLNKYIVSESNGNNYHASGMSSSEKNKILQAIDYLKNKCKAETVFFINKELIDVNDNRELYLRIMASGLLQLLQELNAKGESVKLSVIIARRIDVSNMNKKVIENEEYKKTLNNYIKQKKAMKRITFSEDTEMSFIVDTARKNVKLIMADYICNTKLTLSSRKFNDEERKKINKIISSGYQFSLTEDTSENIIKQSLVKGNISDALFELVTNPKSNFIKKNINMVIDKLNEMGYRGQKVQFMQCAKEFTTYGYMEDDFEVGEEYLKIVIEDIIPVLKKNNYPCEQFHFAVSLMLSDMYLREGDLNEAKKELLKCREVQKKLPNSIENILTFYQLLEKEAVFLIDSFRYKEAYDKMSQICEAFKSVIASFEKIEIIKNRYDSLISEYYGDALCMKIYAGLFMMRNNKELYDAQVRDSDIALKQYGRHEGELERHRQYRSWIETEKKKFNDAAAWLLVNKIPDVFNNSTSKNITKEDFVQFIELINKEESSASREWYLMYYMHIMSEAVISNDSISKYMYDALCETIYKEESKSDYETNTIIVKELDKVKEKTSNIQYHPQEIIYWKMANYYYKTNTNKTKMLRFYYEALKICKSQKYVQLRILALGINAELVCALIDIGDMENANKEYGNMCTEIKLLDNNKYVINEIPFFSELKKSIKEVKTNGVLNKNKMWEVSRKITW